MATCYSQSNRFRRHSSRTMTGRCRSWMRTWQGGNMPILLKTQVESADKTPIPACRARVGGMCGFRSAAERVSAGSPKTGRCADVREHCGHGKRRKRTAAGGFRQREKPQAAKQDKQRRPSVGRPPFFVPEAECRAVVRENFPTGHKIARFMSQISHCICAFAL